MGDRIEPSHSRPPKSFDGNFGPRFAKLASLSFGEIDMTLVPPDFSDQYLGSVRCRNAKLSIQGISEHIWKVDVIVDDGYLWLESGWKKFVHDNLPSLDDWMLLIFRYEGSMNFVVSRYAPTGDLFEGQPRGVKHSLKLKSTYQNFPSFCVQISPSTATASSQNIPEGTAERMRPACPMAVTLRMEGPPYGSGVVFVETKGNNVQFTRAWHNFVQDNRLYIYNWVVFLITDVDEISVSGYTVPSPSTAGGTTLKLVDPIVLSSSNDEVQQSEGSDSWSSGSEEGSLWSDAELLAPNFPWFDTPIQKNTAQIPVYFVTTYLTFSGKWDSELYVPGGHKSEVGVVKSKKNLKFSRGFSKFMEKNNIKAGDSCRFSYLGNKRFFVRKN